MKGHGSRLHLLSETIDTKVNDVHVSLATSFDLRIRLHRGSSPIVLYWTLRARYPRQHNPFCSSRTRCRMTARWRFFFCRDFFQACASSCQRVHIDAHQRSHCFRKRHVWVRHFEEEWRTSFLWYRAFRVLEIASTDLFPSRRYHRRAALLLHSAFMMSRSSV